MLQLECVDEGGGGSVVVVRFTLLGYDGARVAVLWIVKRVFGLDFRVGRRISAVISTRAFCQSRTKKALIVGDYERVESHSMLSSVLYIIY
jgi:hypothetical protein